MPLDDRTAERIATVIVDMGGPYERKSYELEPLLARAGWVPAPEYDGTPRVRWLAEQLIEHRDDHARIERLLCRVCDPIEYDDGAEVAEEFRTILNEKLMAERLIISLVGGRPVLGEIGSDGSAQFTAPDDLDERISGLIVDTFAADLLVRRLSEARICASHGAHTMAVIGIGSLVEGLLYSVLVERDPKIRECGFTNEKGKEVSPHQVGLAMLISLAHDNGWIQFDARAFMDRVREFRNFIHPRLEMEKQSRFDDDTVMMCWAPVRALLNDLEEHLPPVPR
ncbi:hypothetical protein BJ969_002974 [Saccharopolyspora gloriosae]|uniref:DUF4145 domain-containing protein n=1 Tax=Saccharopolyspora gloriosae TaxID=455344 RepID=A0A840NC67_9PSEU|nr:hypothetical protein [Saccharopolyspora gloriosae]